MSDFSAAIRKLEFDKVVQRITRLAHTDPGKALCQSLVPSSSTSDIKRELSRVSEMKTLVIAEGSLPLDGVKNIAPHLKKCSVENQYLTPIELLEISAVLHSSREVQGFLGKRKTLYPLLAEFLGGLVTDKIVEFNIGQAVEEGGRLRDTASKDLRMIRSDMISLAAELRKRLSSILRQVAEQEYTQDDIITTRDGRFVIPVKTEFKQRVPGFIHSNSASGATVFIEPAETLDLNNALRELQFSEQREIERILRDLTAQVRELREPLEKAVSTLAALDLLNAKARYSIEVLGNAPQLSEKPLLRVKEARHPLLLQRHAREEVVPLNLDMGSNDVHTLLITGPNAGGKSVTLTAVGLLSLCVQAGIHIPASPDSEFFVFDRVFVDIGDNQSLENDLSTFSSHLVNMGDILSNADRKSLVLIDEIGAGTDPAEGGALAAAVLQRLTERKALTIATTHHGALKAFAHETPGFANGSMEFDPDSLAPTYHFRFGVPGSSYALELAQRMGFDPSLLDDARGWLGEEKTRVESLIVTLEKEIQEYRGKMRLLANDRDHLELLVRGYEEKMADVRREVRDIKRQAAEEVKDLVRTAQATIENAIKNIRESSASSASIRAAKEDMRRVHQSTLVEGVNTHRQQPDLKVGDFVTLHGSTEVGEIIALKKSDATVLWKSGTLKTPVRELEKASRRSPPTGPKTGNFDQTRELRNELDLRGLTGDEAVVQVHRFLDDAYAAGLHRVDLIHGKGTGALRKKIGEFLSGYPHIKVFRLGDWNEGGSGVTVVELAGD